jgi:hypothetical protein
MHKRLSSINAAAGAPSTLSGVCGNTMGSWHAGQSKQKGVRLLWTGESTPAAKSLCSAATAFNHRLHPLLLLLLLHPAGAGLGRWCLSFMASQQM